jgi:transcriptional regulator with XRE-family HTH domain
MKESFGEFIHRLRIQHGYTLTQLGAQLGIDSGALSKIENGKKRVDKKCLPLLAKVFSIDSETLKKEFFSEMIAQDIISNSCDESVLRLAEEKIKYLKSKSFKQSTLNF